MKARNVITVGLRPILQAAIAILILGASMGESASNGVTSWKEEAQLHDGQSVIVERSQTRGGRREIGQEAPLAQHTVSFEKPGTREAITWSTEYGMEIEKSSLQLLALDIVAGVPYIVTTPIGCIAHNKWNRPNPPYVVFKHDGGRWKHVDPSEFPKDIREANVVIGTQLHEQRLTSAAGVVPATEVKKINAEAKNPDVLYLRLFVREPIRTAQTTCEELVYYKGAWVGPGNSIGRRMMDRVGK